MYEQEKINDFYIRAENILATLDKNEAFKIITAELDKCDERYLNDYVIVLNNIRTEKNLDWIENNASRVKNISSNWGHVAALSYFNWTLADKWLTIGRPLSLIALDALIFCTTNGERLNQSLIMRKINPKLVDNPKLEIVARRLQVYLEIDNVPRTKDSVHRIINNIFETGK